MIKTGPAFKVRVSRRDGLVKSYIFATLDEANDDADAWDAAGHEAEVISFFHYG